MEGRYIMLVPLCIFLITSGYVRLGLGDDEVPVKEDLVTKIMGITGSSMIQEEEPDVGIFSALEVDTDPLTLSVGSTGSIDGGGNIDVENMTADVNARDNTDLGGSMKVKDLPDIMGGLGTAGDLIGNVDLKNLTSGLTFSRENVIGGAILGENASAFGGSESFFKLKSETDLKEGTSKLGANNVVKSDGTIKLPGKLGGLDYNMNDVLEVSSSMEFADLSQRSLQILKETNLVVNIDLPGEKTGNVTLEIHPKIDIEGPIVDLSKLGDLRLLQFAERFSKDMGAVSEFSMLTEENVVNALSSGLEFAARLDIFRALAKDIGVISGMPSLVNNIRAVLADMVSILEALKRAKQFPRNVRNIGEALKNFDVSELKVEFTESLHPLKDVGLMDFRNEDEFLASLKPENPFLEFCDAFTGFDIYELSLSHFADKINDAANLAIRDLSKLTLAEIIKELNTPDNIMNVATLVPTIATGVSQLNKTNTGVVESIRESIVPADTPNKPSKTDGEETEATNNIHGTFKDAIENIKSHGSKVKDALNGLDKVNVADIADLFTSGNSDNPSLY